MPPPEQTGHTALIDLAWRIILRVGFRLARLWWRIRRPHHEGALVAIYIGQQLLLVKSSYRAEWGLPGGSIHPGETPEAAAHREMDQEIGFSTNALIPAGSVYGVWDGRRDRVHFPNCGSTTVKLSPRASLRGQNCPALRSQGPWLRISAKPPVCDVRGTLVRRR